MKSYLHLPIKTRSEFLHRHDRFKPTPANLLFLGFTAGCALASIVAILLEHFSR